MAHTSGPWQAMNPMGGGDWGVLSAMPTAGGNFYVATLPMGSHAEAESNARLIAAAPELLQALQAILPEFCDDKVDQAMLADPYTLGRIHAAKAAIAKATS